MSCRDLIKATWTVGGQFIARQKTFAKFDNVIPGLNVKVTHGTCDIEGWTLRAYFKYPGMLETDPCIYQEQLIVSNEATFDLDGTLLGTYGIWEVELVLVGLGADPEKESKATGNSINYEVIKNCEGLEVPPIPPEDTCNTIDELIQLMNDTIDEGNTRNLVWEGTIDTGNTADGVWNATITAGNLANGVWNVTITAGNAANVIWQQTITDGNILFQEIQDLINNGDVIQKGAGFDDIKYPFLKDITDDLEQKYFAPDPRLVLAFIPGQRNIENLEHGVYVKNPLTNGDGTIKSEDVDSLAGVFDDVNKSFYCGEGYENLLNEFLDVKNMLTRGDAVLSITEIEDDKQNISGTSDSNTGLTFDQTVGSAAAAGEEWYFLTKIKNNGTENLIFAANVVALGIIIEPGETNEIDVIGISSTAGLIRYRIQTETDGGLVDFDVWKEKQILKNSNHVPFVKDTAPAGKVIIKEGWTSETHTIIIYGAEKNLTNATTWFTYCNLINVGTVERINISSGILDDIGDVNVIISKNFNNVFQNDNEYTPSVVDQGGSGGVIRFSVTSIGNTGFKGIYIYEGELSEQESRNELEKIKSGKMYIPNTGVYEPIQGAIKRANEYGQTKPYVLLESQSTDIQLVETDKVVTTRSFDRTIRVDTISSLGVITGDGGVEDINGYIRLTVATSPSPTTKVKLEVEYDG